MKQSNIPLYIRFGEIPEDGQSKVHRSDEIIRNEGGVSVWRAVEDQGYYWPLLPDEPNKNTIADYFSMLLDKYDNDRNVYLVTGTELCIEGADREPLLMDVKIIKDISSYYKKTPTKKRILEDLIKLGVLTKDGADKYLHNKNESKKDATINEQKGSVVTLIGSMKFWEEFLSVAIQLERDGKAVLLPFPISVAIQLERDGKAGLLPFPIKDPSLPPNAWTPDWLQRNLDKSIRKKIDICDKVHVINVDGYIGESTRSEIEYAESLGKQITYLYHLPEEV